MIEVQAGDIGVSGGNSFMQRAIKFFIGGKFSHSFVVFERNRTPYALETTSTIICSSPMCNKQNENNYVKIYRIKDPEKRQKVIDDIDGNIYQFSGVWYGYLSYIWYMYRYLCRKVGKEPTRMWRWCNRGITCTELTVTSLIDTFWHLFPYDHNVYDPVMLDKILTENPHEFECLGWYKE